MSKLRQIFLTDYASYNNGSQFEFGHWVDLSDYSDAEELMEYIKDHLKECDEISPLDTPREEIMITDFEGFPDRYYSECMGQEEFNELYEYIDAIEASHLDEEVFEAYACYVGEEYATIEAAEEAYQGEYNSDEDFAESFAEELGYLEESKGWPHSCIDWEWAAKELMYDYFESSGYYFRNL